MKVLALASVSTIAVSAPAQAQSWTAPKPVTPRYGDIQPFYGDISPFYGDISPFYGDIAPFYGDISPFYGDINPFWGDINPFYGDISPFYGDISPFWGDINPFTAPPTGATPEYEDITKFWADKMSYGGNVTPVWEKLTPRSPSGDYATVVDKFNELVTKTGEVWEPAVKAKTGMSFKDGFAKPMFAKYGIDLASPEGSLDKFTAADRARFFLDWYDQLMTYSGADHVDHWMGTSNWSPSITQQQGGGADTIIGLLDFTVAGDTVIQGSIVKYDGISNFSNGHGAAVASLMVAAHDGKGVMGIAPRARVVAYNPFDSSGTANWDDIRKGVLSLATNGASIINMSLGVPGYALHPDWNRVFNDSQVSLATRKSVFVIAAGNEGKSQTESLSWSMSDPHLIVVGSVGMNEKISNFSNRPGTACLSPSTFEGCAVGSRLMDNFIVAPGEMILVSDDKGGVTRATGTSISAPIVSGAVALLHDRWAWLANYPKETTDIILKSAKDLGAPGVDAVYGVGLLDIAASQSPLNFNNLTWYEMKDGKLAAKSANHVKSTAVKEDMAKWDAKGMYFYAFEKIGATQRDFAIPLSEKLIGQGVTTQQGTQEKFQLYLLERLQSWAGLGFAEGSSSTHSLTQTGLTGTNPWGREMTISAAPRAAAYGFVNAGLPYQSMVRIDGEASQVTFGFGDGAVALNGLSGFTAADHDAERGGANPFLGLASGGGFAQWGMGLSDRLWISAGATQRSDKRDPNILVGVQGSGAEEYQAAAQHIALDYALTSNLTLVGGYTRLREKAALLGVQSLDASDFAAGTTTDGVSLGLDLRLSDSLTFSATGSRGQTRQNAAGQQNIAVGPDGITSTAYELALSKTGLFAKDDRARFSLSQPMFVEAGQVNFRTVQVVDRTTGELGIVTQSLDVSAKARPYAAEFLYGRPLMDGMGEITLFGRAEGNEGEPKSDRYIAGGRFSVKF